MNKRLLYITIISGTILWSSHISVKASTNVDKLYKNAFDLVMISRSNRNQMAINDARNAVEMLKDTSASFAIGEFSKLIDQVQEELFKEFMKIIFYDSNNPIMKLGQGEINKARRLILDFSTFKGNMPYISSWQSIIDRYQQNNIDDIILNMEKLRNHYDLGNAKNIGLLIDSLMNITDNRDILAFAKILKKDLDVIITNNKIQEVSNNQVYSFQKENEFIEYKKDEIKPEVLREKDVFNRMVPSVKIISDDQVVVKFSEPISNKGLDLATFSIEDFKINKIYIIEEKIILEITSINNESIRPGLLISQKGKIFDRNGNYMEDFIGYIMSTEDNIDTESINNEETFLNMGIRDVNDGNIKAIQNRLDKYDNKSLLNITRLKELVNGVNENIAIINNLDQDEKIVQASNYSDAGIDNVVEENVEIVNQLIIKAKKLPDKNVNINIDDSGTLRDLSAKEIQDIIEFFLEDIKKSVELIKTSKELNREITLQDKVLIESLGCEYQELTKAMKEILGVEFENNLTNYENKIKDLQLEEVKKQEMDKIREVTASLTSLEVEINNFTKDMDIDILDKKYLEVMNLINGLNEYEEKTRLIENLSILNRNIERKRFEIQLIFDISQCINNINETIKNYTHDKDLNNIKEDCISIEKKLLMLEQGEELEGFNKSIELIKNEITKLENEKKTFGTLEVCVKEIVYGYNVIDKTEIYVTNVSINLYDLNNNLILTLENPTIDTIKINNMKEGDYKIRCVKENYSSSEVMVKINRGVVSASKCFVVKNTGRISGQVKEKDKGVITGATLTFFDDNGTKVLESTSDYAGMFWIRIESGKRYTLKVNKVGYEEAVIKTDMIEWEKSIRLNTIKLNKISTT